MLKTVLKDNRGSAQAWLLGIAFVIILGVGIYALVFKNFGKPAAKPATTTSVPAGTVTEEPYKHQALTINDIVIKPNVYEFKRVLLLRAITKGWVTDRAFLAADVPTKNPLTGQTSSSRPMLVMRKEPFSLPEHAPDGMLALGEEGKLFHLEGVIRYFDVDAIQTEWGIQFSEADKAALKKYGKKPVLLIEVIEPYKQP